MATVNAQPGRNFLVKYSSAGSSPFTYATVTGLRATKLTINSAPVDVTNKGSSGHQEWGVGMGVDSFELTGSGVYDDGSVPLQAVQAAAMPGQQTLVQLEIIDVTTMEKYVGKFAIATFELDAPYNTERTFSTTIRSSGTIVYTAGT